MSSVAPTGAVNPFADFASSVLAAQVRTMQAVAHHWAHSTEWLMAMAPAWRPEGARDGFGPAAPKIEGKAGEVRVGYETSFSRRITTELIEAFGEVSGDESRLHYDEDYAKRTRFGGRISHGILVASFVSAALSRLPGVVVYLSQDIKFTGPARPGDLLTATVTVVERPEGKSWARLRTLVTKEDGSSVLEGEAKVLVLEES